MQRFCRFRFVDLTSATLASLVVFLGPALQACLLFCAIHATFFKDFEFRAHEFSIITVLEVSRVR